MRRSVAKTWRDCRKWSVCHPAFAGEAIERVPRFRPLTPRKRRNAPPHRKPMPSLMLGLVMRLCPPSTPCPTHFTACFDGEMALGPATASIAEGATAGSWCNASPRFRAQNTGVSRNLSSVQTRSRPARVLALCECNIVVTKTTLIRQDESRVLGRAGGVSRALIDSGGADVMSLLCGPPIRIVTYCPCP